MADRVLRDLHDDRLTVAQHPLDADRLLAVGLAVGEDDVAAVEHAVLGRADVDERGFHPGQHVLDAAEIDVAVDRRRVVGGQRDVVLDERAALEHADVGHAVVALVHDHQVAAGGPALAARAPPALERLLVERLEDRGAVDVDVADGDARVDVGGRRLLAIGCRRSGRTRRCAAARPYRCRPRRRPCCGRAHPGAGGASSGRRRRPAPRRSPAGRGRVARGAGRLSPIRGFAARGDVAAGRLSPTFGAPLRRAGRPASSRASSPRSSLVSPRSAASSVQSSPAEIGPAQRRRRCRRRDPSPMSSALARRPAPAGFFRPRPPREPRRRRFFAAAGSPDPFDSGPFDSGSRSDSCRYPAQCRARLRRASVGRVPCREHVRLRRGLRRTRRGM